MKLYFGNTVTTVTTVMIVGLLAFLGYCVFNQANISHWGRKSAFLFVYGLVVCCFAATRDGLDKTIQCAIDGSCAPGIFPLLSVPTVTGCIGALLILIGAVATLLFKSPYARRIWFYVMSSGVLLKIVTMEIARISMTMK